VKTPSTSTSASSRMSQATSIATPESLMSKGSGGDSWSAESEMELALEVVNHLPADVADRLIDRLRATEAARCSAEERCAALINAMEAAASQPESPQLGQGAAAERELAGTDDLTPGRSRCFSCRFLFLGLALAVALAVICIPWLLFAPMPQAAKTGASPSEGELAASAVSASPVVNLSSGGAIPLDVNSTGPSDAVAKRVDEASADHEHQICQAALQEVREDVRILNQTRWQLEERYNKVLEDMSSWVAFLRNSPGFFGEKASEKKETYEEARQLEDTCIEAARPGWNALRRLAPVRKGREQSDDRRALDEEVDMEVAAEGAGALREAHSQGNPEAEK